MRKEEKRHNVSGISRLSGEENLVGDIIDIIEYFVIATKDPSAYGATYHATEMQSAMHRDR